MNQYKNLSQEALIENIKEQKIVIEELIGANDQEELLTPFSSDYLGDWYWDVKENKVTGNDRKFLALNYKKEDVPSHMGHQFFTDKIHPEDYDKVMDNMSEHLKGNIPFYEVRYKIQTKDGHWKSYYDRGNVTKRDKNGNPLLLAGIVVDITKEVEMTTLVKEQNKILLELIETDSLTDVYNRKALYEKLEAEIKYSNENKTNLTILMIDVDDFKSINDTHGHLVGDNILKKIATVIKDSIRDTDIVGRFGGEEFLVLLPNTTQEKCHTIAERIRENIEKLKLPSQNSVTISGGVKEYNHETIDSVIDKADKMMYEAKKHGKNKINYFNE